MNAKFLEAFDCLKELVDELQSDKDSAENEATELRAELEERTYADGGPVLICGGGNGSRFTVMDHSGTDCKDCRTLDEAIEEFRLRARCGGYA